MSTDHTFNTNDRVRVRPWLAVPATGYDGAQPGGMRYFDQRMRSPCYYPGTVTGVDRDDGVLYIVALDGRHASLWSPAQAFPAGEVHRPGCGCGHCDDLDSHDPRTELADLRARLRGLQPIAGRFRTGDLVAADDGTEGEQRCWIGLGLTPQEIVRLVADRLQQFALPVPPDLTGQQIKDLVADAVAWKATALPEPVHIPADQVNRLRRHVVRLMTADGDQEPDTP